MQHRHALNEQTCYANEYSCILRRVMHACMHLHRPTCVQADKYAA